MASIIQAGKTLRTGNTNSRKNGYIARSGHKTSQTAIIFAPFVTVMLRIRSHLRGMYGNLEGFQRHDHHRRIWPAAYSLAIATMTFDHHQRAGTAFIADFAANASAGKGKIHRSEFILISEKCPFCQSLTYLPVSARAA
jgi:hypothetical protein